MDPRCLGDLRSRTEPRRDPPWLYVLAGWLIASAHVAVPDTGLSAADLRARAPCGALEPPETDPDRMSVRELRGLPAIGPARALEIARARWERGIVGGPEAWEDVPGIGPETVRAIRARLDGEERVVSDPTCP